MAILESIKARSYKQSLDACEEPWLLAVAHEGNAAQAEVPSGLLGVIDWRLHGKLSKLLSQGEITENHCGIFNSPNKLGRASLLLYCSSKKITLAPLLKSIEQLQVKSICLAEDTFPEDFSEKLKDNLDKAGIRWAILESKNR